ncbi:uncharacterized protein [Procambarus clarkii]|uniref:uncharacterized protein isoform X1 n=1 Tax=Procambarus clarkii TaxID=6728 RepID=UPI001E675BEC|nr:uncharacterized protein LOC123755023 isoform X1 [Procambarus clarkii]
MSHHRSYSCHKYGLAVVGMDNSPLNQAHREQRRAESCQRGGRLEEAAEYHGQAAKLLTKALALTVTPLARQSITLQHGYHIRQQELLRFRSKQLEKYVKAMENHRLKMGSASGNTGGGFVSGNREFASAYQHVGKKTQTLLVEMTKNTEKFDSLLSLLLPEENDTSGGGQTESKCKQSPQEKEGELACDMKETLNAREITVKTLDVRGTKCSEKVTQTETAKRGESSIGIKKEKDVLVIVEELRTLRDHQADLISQLMTELSFREKENTLLKNQVCELQTKCEQYESERRRMRAMADSSCSPFVFSPLSELSPDPPGVPDLAPLEMPPLDFMENFEQDS